MRSSYVRDVLLGGVSFYMFDVLRKYVYTRKRCEGLSNV